MDIEAKLRRFELESGDHYQIALRLEAIADSAAKKQSVDQLKRAKTKADIDRALYAVRRAFLDRDGWVA